MEPTTTGIFGVDGHVNFSFTNHHIGRVTGRDFCEVYNMKVLCTMMVDEAFHHRSLTKKQIEAKGRGVTMLKEGQVDTFAKIRDAVANVGADGLMPYKMGRTHRTPRVGRLYDVKHNIMAYTNSGIRSVALEGMVEIDQKKCHPTLFKMLYTNIMKKLPVTATRLIEDPEGFIIEVMAFYNLVPTPENRKMVKVIVLAINYGGGVEGVFKKSEFQEVEDQFKDQDGEFKYAPALTAFKKEVREVMEVVKLHYRGVYDMVALKGNIEHKNITRTLSFVLQEMETCISSIAVMYLIDEGVLRKRADGLVRMTFLHDGFFVPVNETINDELLVKLTEHVRDVTGVPVSFGFKVVDPNYTTEEKAVIERVVLATEAETIAKMWMMAKLVFPIPSIVEPEGVEDGIMRATHGYDFHFTQEGVSRVRVDVWRGGELRGSDTIGEIDTIDDDLACRDDMARGIAAETFGATTMENGLIDVQLPRRPGEYVEMRELVDGEYVKMRPRDLLETGKRHTVYIKGTMGSGKSYMAINDLINPALQMGKGAISLTPNKSLAQAMGSDCARGGVPMSMYTNKKALDRKRKRGSDDGDDTVTQYMEPKVRAVTVRGKIDVPSGDARVVVKPGGRDDRAIITTIDSILKVPEDVTHGVLFGDETSKLYNQVASGTMDRDASRRMTNIDRLKMAVAKSTVVLMADADMTSREVKITSELRPDTRNKYIYYANSHYRLDYQRVPTESQLRHYILQDLFVWGTPVAVACSTNAGSKRQAAMVVDFAQGRIDTFMRKVDRTTADVIEWIADTVMITTEEASVRLLRVLNGVNHICGDETPHMRKSKELLLKESYAVGHWRRDVWSYDDDDDDDRFTLRETRMQDLQLYPTMILSYSPSITIGVSFQTGHFKTMYGLFNSVSVSTSSLAQMLRRIRKLFTVRVYEGVSRFNGVAHEKKMEQAVDAVKRYATSSGVGVDPWLADTYRHIHVEMGGQEGRITGAMARTLINSNPYNLMSDLSVDPAVGGVRSEVIGDEAIEAIVRAKVLITFAQLKGALPEEKSKFHSLARYFPVFGDTDGTEDLHVQDMYFAMPDYLNDNHGVMRKVLKNGRSIRFIHLLFTAAHNPTYISKWVLDSFTNSFKVDVRDALTLVGSLGFREFRQFIDWCLHSSRGPCPRGLDPGEFVYDGEVVERVVGRLGIDTEGDGSEAVKTLRALNALLLRRCPVLKVKKGMPVRKRRIHGCRTERVLSVDVEFINFYDEFMNGVEPTSPWLDDSADGTGGGGGGGGRREVVKEGLGKCGVGSMLVYSNFAR